MRPDATPSAARIRTPGVLDDAVGALGRQGARVDVLSRPSVGAFGPGMRASRPRPATV